MGRMQGLPEEGPQRAAYVDAAIAAALAHFPEGGHMAAAASEKPVVAFTRSRLMVRCICRHSNAKGPAYKNSPVILFAGPWLGGLVLHVAQLHGASCGMLTCFSKGVQLHWPHVCGT